MLLFMMSMITINAAVYQDEHASELRKIKFQELVQVSLVQYPWRFSVGKVPADYFNMAPVRDVISFAGRDDGSTFDLDTVLPQKAAPLAEGVLYIEFDSPRDGVMHLGAACDWWFEIYLNGVLCATTMRGGNGLGDAFSCEDHKFFAPVKKGRNLLAAKVKRGNNSWRFALGRTMVVYPDLPEVAAGPWLLFPDSNCMTLLFRTAGNVPAGVQYRRAGSESWQKVYDQRGNAIVPQELHRVTLKDLQPGSAYEYCIIMRDPKNPGREIVDKNVGRFIVPDEKNSNYSFLFVADMQFNPQMQREYLTKLFRHADAVSCDFIVYGGDMCDFFIPETYEQVLLDVLPPGKPLVMLRGNHELRGKAAGKYMEYFAVNDFRSYGMFRWGDTAFLLLDTMGKSEPKRPGKNERALILPELIEEHKQFVRDCVKSPRWQQAKRRIVMAHAAPNSHDLNEQITLLAQELTDEFFEGSEPVSLINMYLTGHTHKYSRSIPGSNRIASYNRLPWKVKSPVTYRYPVITTGGPDPKEPVNCTLFRIDASSDKLALKVIGIDGRIIENIEYYNNGSAVEKQTINQFEY